MEFRKIERKFPTPTSHFGYIKASSVLCLFLTIARSFLIVTTTDARTAPTSNELNTENSTVNLDKAYEAAASLEFEIELSISARNLVGPLGRVLHAKLDSTCTTWLCPHPPDRKCFEYHQTEKLKGESNPNFAKKVTMPYSSFQRRKRVMFVFFEKWYWNDSVSVGSVECEVGKLLDAGKTELPLHKRDDFTNEVKSQKLHGHIIIHAEKLINNYNEVTLKLKGTELAKKYKNDTPDAYVEIYKRSVLDDGYVLVYRTEVIKNSLDPQWGHITIPIRNLCNGNYDRILKFVCWDWNRFGKSRHKPIGEFDTTFNDILDSTKSPFILKHKNVISGEIHMESEIHYVPSFADFVKGGLQIHGTIAIDYSIQNGLPRKKNTLHYCDPDGALNQYEKCIIAAVNAFKTYGDDKFTVLGFGARYPGKRHDDLVFNANPGSADYIGVDEILAAYRECAFLTTFDWPPDSAQVIDEVIDKVKASRNPNSYFTLIILTRGGIFDDYKTERVIKQAAELPLSIVFVGIGGNHSTFESLRMLDVDNVRRGIHRDIVKFVQFNKFNSSFDIEETRSDFESELLAEIPLHVVSYMRYHGRKAT